MDIQDIFCFVHAMMVSKGCNGKKLRESIDTTLSTPACEKLSCQYHNDLLYSKIYIKHK